MKVAVTCECIKGKCTVSHHFGLAPLICIYENGKEVERFLNPYIKAERRRGRSLVEYLIRKGVNVIVAPEAGGPGVTEAALTYGVKIITKAPGTPVEEVLKEIFGALP
ncbi:hypothetical protein EYM_06480 [Ignicoccus islandicus DSM 13165]|uniref:Dinitrogenase iron-molybdenum cofactor biosynthesis domain-containing protein n=1 Tax=Ignicoccus islandicus DSM 13165 TaxID=940295 RepID=A0A0U2VFC0_9CREN|nr:NifB/NifX family molybdenum-iron cluster-binding protein [Ignicoccus islandicus]ALU12690.1 hypothetical protein EYM_06480 [Ignicoccus islandicus DSM 13165]